MSLPFVWPGRPFPLGAHFDGQGVNFAVFSENATQVEVCLHDPGEPNRETDRFLLPEATAHVFHGYVPGLRPGAVYGFRAHGVYAPERGHRFNPQKLLVDPYARALRGKVDWSGPVHGFAEGKEDSRDGRDDQAWVPKSVVVDDGFDWGDDAPPRTPRSSSVLYELHVGGFTRRHPAVPSELRGTYLGLAAPPVLDHLRSLGVTAVELLPVHEAVTEGFLAARGLTNYWGYSTVGFFAPDQRFASVAGAQVREFKQMVKALHRAGLEVILDVVYNHTGEGNQAGPTLCFRGLDNATYYQLEPGDFRRYHDVTGTGNTVRVEHPQVLTLVLDSLRYWVEKMHVDGFRFDLAPTLGREGGYRRESGFMRALHQDPVLSRVKLIAEPWDLGEGGYQVGNFPVLWSEWNGKYRDAVRRYWRGDRPVLAELGYRLTGSSDLFRLSGRTPEASINLVTVHDGFTLEDMVSYEQKHNQPNGEENRDGTNENYGFNFGIEGPSADPAVLAERDKQKRNLLATLFLSQGVPMLCAGDELGRTQRGNNNAYCQDNEVSWVDWQLDERRRALLAFTRRMIALRQEQPVLRRRRFFRGAQIWDSEFKDLAWFRPDGHELTPDDWRREELASVAFLLGGDAIPTLDEHGERVTGDTLLVLLNPEPAVVAFTLPASEWGADWEILVETAHPEGVPSGRRRAGGQLEVPARALVVLQRSTSPGEPRGRPAM